MAKDMLDAIYNAEEDCRQREANARAESEIGRASCRERVSNYV